MRSLRSDTLTMRVTGARIAVFSSAIVIDVVVHCYPAGAPFESNGRKQFSLSSCGWVLIRLGQFKITHFFLQLVHTSCQGQREREREELSQDGRGGMAGSRNSLGLHVHAWRERKVSAV